MYKCLECGHLFEEGEQARWEESRGEFWGSPCSESMSGCPICKGYYEEAVKCKICGRWVEDEYCDDCKSRVIKLFSALMQQNFTSEEKEMIAELIIHDDLEI